MITVSELKTKSSAEIFDILNGLYEKSPWVAEEISKNNMINDKCNDDSVTTLATALKDIVESASYDKKLELIRAHPDLASKASIAKEMTLESQDEQKRAGLNSLTEDEMILFNQYNEEYKNKFGFPFILAVRNVTKYTILAAMNGRLKNNPQIEFEQCLSQIHKIAWMRLLTKVQFKPIGFLTCHILDTANGCPAANLKVTLNRIDGATGNKTIIKEFITNSDGRTGKALDGEDFTPGIYEWIFYCGSYFAAKGLYTTGTPFLDEIPIRFGIDNPEDHYHVPLLVSPWSFSTYRGS